MGVRFNADEIFEMAEQIERNGAMFYRGAAERFSEPPSRNKILDLAAMEERHEKIFSSMREELSAGERMKMTFDPENQAALYLQAMADTKIFTVKDDPLAALSEGNTIADILQTAIGLEKDSVVFYTGIREMVPDKLGKEKINDIIKEEMGHIVDLTSQLELLKK